MKYLKRLIKHSRIVYKIFVYNDRNKKLNKIIFHYFWEKGTERSILKEMRWQKYIHSDNNCEYFGDIRK